MWLFPPLVPPQWGVENWICPNSHTCTHIHTNTRTKQIKFLRVSTQPGQQVLLTPRLFHFSAKQNLVKHLFVFVLVKRPRPMTLYYLWVIWQPLPGHALGSVIGSSRAPGEGIALGYRLTGAASSRGLATAVKKWLPQVDVSIQPDKCTVE